MGRRDGVFSAGGRKCGYYSPYRNVFPLAFPLPVPYDWPEGEAGAPGRNDDDGQAPDVERDPMTTAKIAINAQINPDTAGGVETNIKSLIRSLSESPNGLEFELLGHPLHHHQLREFAPDQFGVIDWPYGQDAVMRRGSDALIGALKAPAGSGRKARLVAAGKTLVKQVKAAGPGGVSRSKIDALLKQKGVGAVHFTNPLFFNTGLPFIIEPWDLQYKHYPEFFDSDELAWRERNWTEGCRRAKLVMTATEWVKQDIVEKMGVPPEKIAVIPRNSHLGRAPMEPIRAREILNERGLPKRFAFYPAMSFPHKNHIRLLRALAKLRDQGMEVPLVLSGRHYKPHFPEVAKEIKALGLQQQVFVLGAVSEEMLTALFKGAAFMIFPSLFEGLGLPILEAFEQGLPVFAARETCTPEVAGPGALLFDGKDEDAIADALRRGWTRPEELEILRQAGFTRLAHFSWDKAVRMTTACYKHVLGQTLDGEDLAAFEEATGTGSAALMAAE